MKDKTVLTANKQNKYDLIEVNIFGWGNHKVILQVILHHACWPILQIQLYSYIEKLKNIKPMKEILDFARDLISLADLV